MIRICVGKYLPNNDLVRELAFLAVQMGAPRMINRINLLKMSDQEHSHPVSLMKYHQLLGIVVKSLPQTGVGDAEYCDVPQHRFIDMRVAAHGGGGLETD